LVTTPEKRHRLGFGVTAYSVEDAFHLLSKAGYVVYTEAAIVQAHISPHEIDAHHVALNAGRIRVRGGWYPFLNL